MATVSSIGVGSGLPLDDLLTKLRSSENRVLTVIQRRQTAAEAKLSAYGKLQDAVSTLQTAAQAVAETDTFGALKATSGSDAISATVDSTAIPGQYGIQVTALASAQTLVAAGRADRTSAIGTDGSIAITLADGTIHTLDMTGQDTSLDGLIAAINADPDLGVNATLVNDGSGTPYRLLLTARNTGTEAAITKIEVTGNTDLQNFIGYDKVGGNTSNFSEQVATDAQISINGIQITSQTNTLSDVIDGVDLTLNKITSSPTSLSIARDNTVATQAVKDFVTAYNSFQDTLDSLTAYHTTDQESSALTGDSLARRVQTELRSALNTASSGGTNPLSLFQIGITTDPSTGKLSVDDAKLDDALSNDLQGVTSLFTSATGVGKLISDATDRFTRSDGLFSITTESLNTTISQIQNQYQATADRIDQRMDTYRQQFVKLDAMVSQMNSISSYLTQQLSMLSTSKSSQ
jgi:flagellar hook-associated protein 2